MKHFESYLQEKGLAGSSVRTYVRVVKQFENHFGFTPATGPVTYEQLQTYVSQLLALGWQKRYINEHLNALSHYLDYRRQWGGQPDNPARNFRLRGIKRPLPAPPLDFAKLEEAYRAYREAFPEALRRAAMLSLLIYQGAAVSDLATLQKEDLALEKGTVHFPGSAKTAPRSLELHVSQILLLQNHLTKQPEEKPFASGRPLSNQVAWLLRGFRRYCPQVKNAAHLRSSRISDWLRREDLRKVQYWAGHRYVSSTERYEQAPLDQLKEELNRYHPLN